MDSSNFFYIYHQFLETTNDFEIDSSIMPLSQSKVSNLNNQLLQLLYPSDDTIKTYLNEEQYDNNVNSDCDQSTNLPNIMNLDVDRLHFNDNYRFQLKPSKFDHTNAYDMSSASIYSDLINYLVYHLIYNNNLNLSVIYSDHWENTETYYQNYEDYQVLQSNQQFTYNDYVKLRGNNSFLAQLGFKFSLTLNIDNDKVQENWNPKIAQKILSVDYSFLGLVKDHYQAHGPLDRLESFLLTEVVKAFQHTEPIELPEFSFKVKPYPSPFKFVSISRKLKSFRKICNHDKIELLSSSFYEIVSKKFIFNYNQATDEWINPEYGTRFGRRDFFLWNRLLHDKAISVIEALPDRWRDDEVVEALISLIIIFNPEQTEILFAHSVRHEQYMYIHLLKRYLESVCESPCDASDNLYRLLVGVEKFRELGELICKSMNEFEINFHRSLRNLIIDVVNNKRDYKV